MNPSPTVVDIYHGDATPDFKAAYAAGVRGIIHKASQGLTMTDDQYHKRSLLALSNGLMWGAFHWGTGDDVQAQVTHFLEFADPQPGTVVALDWEKTQPLMSIDQAREWAQTIESKLGRKIKLYSGDVVKSALNGKADPYLSTLDLWLPQYGHTPVCPPGWVKPWLWQYGGDGLGPWPQRVSGFHGNMDVSYFNGTEDEFVASWN